MTIRSMTGYGQGAAEIPGFRVRVEARCVNNRFADLRLRLPAELLPREGVIRGLVLSRIKRGRIEIDVRIEGEQAAPTLHLNRSLAQAVAASARTLREDFGASGDVGVSSFLAVPGMLQAVAGSGGLLEPEWETVERAVGIALEALDSERRREGEATRLDLVERVRGMAGLVREISDRASRVPQAARRKLLDRLAMLAEGVALDPGRLEQEAAFLADRADVTEERVRLAGHLEQLGALLASGDSEPVGKRLDFLLQEVHREANTINAKAADLEVSRLVLAFKAEAEKVREQVQNLE
jgi:uncharacterized protein (TIGR00255 family)